MCSGGSRSSSLGAGIPVADASGLNMAMGQVRILLPNTGPREQAKAPQQPPAVPIEIGVIAGAALILIALLATFLLGGSARAMAAIGGSVLAIGALCAAGAFGGLAGAFMLQGEQYTLKAGFSSGYGFDGLVVGLLARGSASGVVAGSLLFGFLRSGGINMEMVAQVPTALVVVIQGLIIVTLAGAAIGIQRMEARRK